MEQRLQGTSFRGRTSQSSECSPALVGPGLIPGLLTVARLWASAEKDCKCLCRKPTLPGTGSSWPEIKTSEFLSVWQILLHFFFFLESTSSSGTPPGEREPGRARCLLPQSFSSPLWPLWELLLGHGPSLSLGSRTGAGSSKGVWLACPGPLTELTFPTPRPCWLEVLCPPAPHLHPLLGTMGKPLWKWVKVFAAGLRPTQLGRDR